MTALGWPEPGTVRARPRWRWLRYVLPGSTQICWIGSLHPRLLAVLFLLEAPAEFGQALVASLRHREIELVVLRASWNAGHVYHYAVHALWARIREGAGFLDAVHAGPADPRWNDREAALLRAVDDLHTDLTIAAPTIARLRLLGFGDRELIEICFITAHYQLLGMLEESAGMPPEPLLGRPRSRHGAQPRWRRAGIHGRAGGLAAAHPWTPDDTALAAHPPLRLLLRWYGRTMAKLSGLDAAAVIAAMKSTEEPDSPDPVRRAVAELDREFFLSDATWRELLEHFGIRQVLELCVLVGHYRTHEMIANTMARARSL